MLKSIPVGLTASALALALSAPLSTQDPTPTPTPPPVQTTSDGHAIACHIPLAELEKVEPVIVTEAAD